MNRKIYELVKKSVYEALMPSQRDTFESIEWSIASISDLDLTPKREEKMLSHLKDELGFDFHTGIPVMEAIRLADIEYTKWFFTNNWLPKTGSHTFTGWQIVDEVMKHNPKHVLDFGCGYNQFKDKIPNLIGIDPYNEAADFMVDIDHFVWKHKFDVILVLGSMNFGDKDDVVHQFDQLVKHLEKGGRMYFRVNPGIQWPQGPYVDIYEWSFELAVELAEKYDMEMESFKVDTDRLYFELVHSG